MSFEIPWHDEHGELHHSSPARDVAYLYPQMLKDLELRLVDKRLNELDRRLMAFEKITLEDVHKAYACYCIAFRLTADPEVPDAQTAMKQSGFLDCPPLAQMIINDRFAKANFGAYSAGIRSCLFDKVYPLSLQVLMRRGQELLDALHPETP